MQRLQAQRAFSLTELALSLAVSGSMLVVATAAGSRVHECNRETICADSLHRMAVALGTYSHESGRGPDGDLKAGERSGNYEGTP